MTYSDVFKNIDVRTVEATKKLVKAGIWKKDLPEHHKVLICNDWLKTVSEVYGIKVPAFRFDESEVMYRQTGGGYYEPAYGRITLFKKFSLTTLLHEFRHHMQLQKAGNLTMYRYDIEEDARAWSMSLFKAATPKAHARAASRRIVHFT